MRQSIPEFQYELIAVQQQALDFLVGLRVHGSLSRICEPNPFERQPSRGMTPLEKDAVLHAKTGKLEKLRACLDAGISPNFFEPENRVSLLMFAAWIGTKRSPTCASLIKRCNGSPVTSMASGGTSHTTTAVPGSRIHRYSRAFVST